MNIVIDIPESTGTPADTLVIVNVSRHSLVWACPILKACLGGALRILGYKSQDPEAGSLVLPFYMILTLP